MATKDPFFLSNDVKQKLDQLKSEWRSLADKLFIDHFGKRYDGNNIVGAGVTIYRKKYRKAYRVMFWYGDGSTYEQESFDQIISKIESLGFYAHYDCGRLD